MTDEEIGKILEFKSTTASSLEKADQTGRKLDALLALDTYQGMTDIEIERLLRYKASASVRAARASGQGRPLDELLKLDSYDDMTNEEIERLTAFKTAIAQTSAATESENTSTQTLVEQMTSNYDSQVESMRTAFKAACAAAPGFATVSFAEA